jgi:hypothetical protein
MGWLMTLQLFGTATHCVGLTGGSDRSVVRLRTLESRSSDTASDFAIVRTAAEFDRAKRANWRSIFFIGEEAGACRLELALGERHNFCSIPIQLSI